MFAMPRRFAATAIGSMPGTPRTLPSKPQLAHSKELAQIAVQERTLRAQNADSDRQIEAGAFLLQVGRRQIDGDVGGRQRKAGVADRCANTIAAFAHGSVRQSDSRKALLRLLDAGEIHLNINDVRIDTVHSSTQRLEEHPVGPPVILEKPSITSGLRLEADHKGCRPNSKSQPLLP